MLLLFCTGEDTDDLYLDQKITCPVCGKKAELHAFCSYKAFRVFFLPVYKWDKRYFVQTSCCGAACPISEKLGEAVDGGKKLDLRRLPLRGAAPQRLKVCAACGYETSQPFRFCPMCGRPFAAGEVEA